MQPIYDTLVAVMEPNLSAVFLSLPGAAASNIRVLVNGRQLEFDVPPVIEAGRTLIPLRFLSENLGATVSWIGDTRTVIIVDGERITLSVPFDKNQSPYGLIPMGETVYHPEEGHGGIDFQWNAKVPILAAAAGVVTAIEKGYYWLDTWDVGVKTGPYLISYGELESYNPELEVGREIPAGFLIGYPWHPPAGHVGYRMIHWTFGYSGGHPLYPEPLLCPMTYFDEESRLLMEEIWARMQWEHKTAFPDICSGAYKGKHE